MVIVYLFSIKHVHQVCCACKTKARDFENLKFEEFNLIEMRGCRAKRTHC